MYNVNAGSFTVIIDAVAQSMFMSDPANMRPELIGMLVSIPSLLMIPGVLLSGVLDKFVRMRTIMLVSWALFGISGAIIYFMDTIFGVLACRAVMGFAIGLCQPSSRALPSRMYDGSVRSKIIGWIGMGGAAVSIVASISTGSLAAIDWRLAMFVYIVLAAIFIILALIFVPNLPVEKHEASVQVEAAAGAQKRPPLGITVWVNILVGFLVFVIGSVIQIETSTHVNQIFGEPRFDIITAVNVFNTLGIVISDFIFGKMYDNIKRWLVPAALLVCAGGYLWFALATDAFSLCASGAVANFCDIGIVMVYCVVRASHAAPPSRVTLAITLVFLAQFLGQVITTPFINFINDTWGVIYGMNQAGAPEYLAQIPLVGTAVAFVMFAAGAFVYVLATHKTIKFDAYTERDAPKEVAE
jgi:predicted MFS family arabinose efflux permease